MKIIRTILADDQRIFIEGLKTVLRERSDAQFHIVGTAYDGKKLIELLQCKVADLLIFDLNLPGKDGLEVLEYFKKKKMSPRVLVLSRYDDPKIVKNAFRCGIDGYILKDKNINELFEATRKVLSGQTFVGEGVAFYNTRRPRRNQDGSYARAYLFQDSFVKRHHLTKREVEILRLITEALSNKEIAKELYISDQTVSVHRKNIMRKLGVSNTAGLIKTAYDHSLV